MAKVLLRPIGSEIALTSDRTQMRQNADRIKALCDVLQARRDEVRAGWGPAYAERVRAKGKLPTWERIDALRDPATPVYPIGTFVNYGVKFGEDGRTSPAAGVITAFVRVCDRWIVLIANDNTVASGSWW